MYVASTHVSGEVLNRVYKLCILWNGRVMYCAFVSDMQCAFFGVFLCFFVAFRVFCVYM